MNCTRRSMSPWLTAFAEMSAGCFPRATSGAPKRLARPFPGPRVRPIPVRRQMPIAALLSAHAC
eukprot:9573133-Alexandrium_andersonii.AAC.1